MNRRGYAPYMVLLVSTLVLAILAGVSFLSFGGKASNLSSETGLMISEVDFYEDYVLESVVLIVSNAVSRGGDVKDNMEEITRERKFGVEEVGDFFGKIRTGDFELYESDGGKILEIKNIVVSSKVGESEIKRTFDLGIDFDNNGSVRKIYKENDVD